MCAGKPFIFLSICEEFGSFDCYLWGFTQGKTIVNRDDVLPTHSALSDRISADLKRRGMKFVGTTIIYSYLQAVGVVNDHELGCDFHGWSFGIMALKRTGACYDG